MSRQRRREPKADRCMDDTSKDAIKTTEDVLLDGGAMLAAYKDVTAGGKKKIEGLYLSGGNRIDGNTDAQEKVKDESEIKNKDAMIELRNQRISKATKTKDKRFQRKAEKLGKTEEELVDDDSAKKADKILAGSNEHDQIMYRDLFNFFDVDKDRTWGSIEFAQRMTDIGCATSVEDASNLLYFAGVRDVDRITYNDFIQLMPKLRAYRVIIEKDAMSAFQHRDPGTGWLSPKLAKMALLDLSGPGGIDGREATRLVKKMDRLKDGRITFDFFIRAMFEGSPPLTEYVPPKRNHPVVKVLLNMIGCGAKRHEREPDEMPADDAKL